MSAPAWRASTSQRTSYGRPAAGGAAPGRTALMLDSAGSAGSTSRLPWWVGFVTWQSAGLTGCAPQAAPASSAAAATPATHCADRTVRDMPLDPSLTGWVRTDGRTPDPPTGDAG